MSEEKERGIMVATIGHLNHGKTTLSETKQVKAEVLNFGDTPTPLTNPYRKNEDFKIQLLTVHRSEYKSGKENRRERRKNKRKNGNR